MGPSTNPRKLRSTTLLLWAGVLALLFGMLALTWPLHTAMAVAVFWGVYAIVDGAAHIALGTRIPGHRGWLVATGIISILAGLLIVGLPALGTTAVVWILAAWLMLRGLVLVVGAFGGSSPARRSLGAVGGLLWILLGAVLFTHPAAGAATLAAIGGIFALLFGIAAVGLGLLLRGVGNQVRRVQEDMARSGGSFGAVPGASPGFGSTAGSGRRPASYDNGQVIEGETTD